MCNCAAQIERAMSKGHSGWAEYLAERCDRNHTAADELRDNTSAEEATDA